MIITSRREFLKSMVSSSITTSLLPWFACSTHRISERPNIIFILSDDLGYGDLGCYGQEKIKTPHLDQMAVEGLLFSQHYAGSTVCAPSRCALMTGKQVGHCSVRGNVDVLMDPQEETLGKLMKRAGYATACIGKWGIGHPPPPDDPHNNGFDYFFGYLSMWHAHNYYPDFLWKNREKVPLRNVVQHPKKHYKANQESLVGLATEKVDYSSDLFTEDALAWVGSQVKPFFLFLSYTIPHANNEAVDFGEHGLEVPDYGIYKNEDWPEAEKGKAAMISRMDGDVGRIFKRLRELGVDSNTLVFFSSDNGPHREGGINPDFFKSSGQLRGIKRDLYEGGIRVPMLARWPGKIKAGGKTDFISAFWDVLPTLSELVGKPIDKNTDGISFLPTLLGKTGQNEHEYLYWEFHEGSSKQAIRLGKWKGIRLAPSKPLELYDLTQDISEQKNIAELFPSVVANIEKILTSVRTGENQWPLQDEQDTMPF